MIHDYGKYLIDNISLRVLGLAVLLVYSEIAVASQYQTNELFSSSTHSSQASSAWKNISIDQSTLCSVTSVKPGMDRINLWSNGILRTSRIYIPPSLSPDKPAMVVLNLHAFLSTPILQEALSQMHRVADEKGFIVVSPHGVANSWNGGNCCGTSFLDLVDDVGFIDDLLDRVESTYCVDKRRIYATGMSNGGFLTHRLGCELSDRIAAIAPVAGVLGLATNDCRPSRSVPYCTFMALVIQSYLTEGDYRLDQISDQN